MTMLHIEPYPGDEKYIKKATKLAKEIAQLGDGIVLDEQKKKTAGKTIQPIEFKKEKRDAWLNVYGDPDSSIYDKGNELLALFERYLPNALPRRYGAFEPPQYKYEVGGKEAFMNFWKEEVNPVWYAGKPVQGVFISEAYRDAFDINQWKCNRFSICILEEALCYENWRASLTKVLYELMVLFEGFYGDIVRGKPENKAWFWKGIPNHRGEVFALGQPYLGLLGVTEKKEIRLFTEKDIAIPREYCLSTEMNEEIGVPINIQAKVWPF
ncbi:MAG: hypothetical protein NC125_08990 [Muribaculaceae bacterium]|nr:hypothetical protein [Muribaculaceae bacterium]